jgi:hypothetical protein
MRRNRAIAVLILLLGLMASGIAWANGARGHGQHHGFRGQHHHGHFHGRASAGIVIGAPLVFGYRYYYPPAPAYVYSYPPPVAAPYPPPAYIERGDSDESDQAGGEVQQGSGYWHYCTNPQGYYPYVKTCPGGWQAVPATPPSQ